MNFINNLIDLFLPKICFHCRVNRCVDHPLLCNTCLSQMQEITVNELNFENSEKFSAAGQVKQLYSLYRFLNDSPIQTLLHELKYQNKFNIGRIFGVQLGKKYFPEFESLGIDIIVPVPLHKLKKAERGYNQSLYFAKGISKIIGRKVRTDVIFREKFTKSQTNLNKKEREENVRDAFGSNKRISGYNILLVDDVITTGATIQACAKVLIECGAKNIYAASIALA